MRHVTLILSLVILTQTAFAVENPLDGPTPQLNKQSEVRAWWTDRDAGWVGGISGSVLGLTGAAIGIMAGFGVARKTCLLLLGAMFVLGVASLALALAALVFSQPYAVYYPPLLIGLLCSTLAPILFFQSNWQYKQRELRKMNAMDIK
jgi:hypothetical protein